MKNMKISSFASGCKFLIFCHVSIGKNTNNAAKHGCVLKVYIGSNCFLVCSLFYSASAVQSPTSPNIRRTRLIFFPEQHLLSCLYIDALCTALHRTLVEIGPKDGSWNHIRGARTRFEKLEWDQQHFFPNFIF